MFEVKKKKVEPTEEIASPANRTQRYQGIVLGLTLGTCQLETSERLHSIPLDQLAFDNNNTVYEPLDCQAS